jgi:hypothetical protein
MERTHKFVNGEWAIMEENKPSQNWTKGGSEASPFYYISERDRKIVPCLFDLRDLKYAEGYNKFEEKVRLASKRGYYPTRINDDWCLIFEKLVSETSDTDIGELPFGCYKYVQENEDPCDRLVPIALREDFFLCNQELFKQIETDVIKFQEAQAIYEEMQVLYKRGVLLYGDPGSGKTSLIRYLTKTLFKQDCHIIWMDHIPGLSLVREFCKIKTLKVFVIEEISSANRNAYEMKVLLEFLDGESSVSNSLVLATTNYPEELAKNLADRPSRFDLVIEIKDPTPTEAKAFFEHFLKQKLDGMFETDELFRGLSISHIKEVCLLSKFYGWPLLKCREKVLASRKRFKENFVPTTKERPGFYS